MSKIEYALAIRENHMYPNESKHLFFNSLKEVNDYLLSHNDKIKTILWCEKREKLNFTKLEKMIEKRVFHVYS